MPATMSDRNEMNEDDGCNEYEEWSVFSSKKFCNVTSKVVVRVTNEATSLLEWIRGQSDFKIYINDMYGLMMGGSCVSNLRPQSLPM